jgi:hypothetical protein
MGENTCLLYDLMDYLEENDMDGLLLLVDFEKAFDSVEWNFLRKALESLCSLGCYGRTDEGTVALLYPFATSLARG